MLGIKKVLVNKIKENDRETYFYLYNEYFKKLVNYVYLIIDDRYEAEDIVQNIFLNLHTKIESFQNRNFESWLFSIARNAAIDFLRSYQSKKIISTDDEEFFVSLDNDNNQFEFSELHDVLTNKEYEIAYLYYKCGFSYNEVCRVSKISNYQFRQIIKNIKIKTEKYYKEVYLCTKEKK